MGEFTQQTLIHQEVLLNDFFLFLMIAIAISFASLGFRAITGPGMVFYFMREWLDKLAKRKADLYKRISNLEKSNRCIQKEANDDFPITPKQMQSITENKSDIRYIHNVEKPDKYNWLLYIMKPFILCSTCMASVHTLIWYPVFFGELDFMIILVMLTVAFMNTILWGTFEAIAELAKTLQIFNKTDEDE